MNRVFALRVCDSATTASATPAVGDVPAAYALMPSRSTRILLMAAAKPAASPSFSASSATMRCMRRSDAMVRGAYWLVPYCVWALVTATSATPEYGSISAIAPREVPPGPVLATRVSSHWFSPREFTLLCCGLDVDDEENPTLNCQSEPATEAKTASASATAAPKSSAQPVPSERVQPLAEGLIASQIAADMCARARIA